MPIDDREFQFEPSFWLRRLRQCWTVALWHWIAVAIGFGLLFADVAFTRSVLRGMKLLPAVLLIFLALGAGFSGYRLSRCSPRLDGLDFATGSSLFVMTFFLAFGLSQSEGERQGGVTLVAITMSLLVLAAISASRWLQTNLFDRRNFQAGPDFSAVLPAMQAEGIPALPFAAESRIQWRPRSHVSPRLIFDGSFAAMAMQVLVWHWAAIILGCVVLFSVNLVALYGFDHHVPYSEYYFAAVQSVTAFFAGCYLRRRRWAENDAAFATGALLFMLSFPVVIIAIPPNHHIQLEALINLFEVPIIMQIGLRTSRRPLHI